MQNSITYLIWPKLEDWEWLQVLQDVEDLDFGPSTMRINLKLRSHLEREKKLMLVHQLMHFN